MFPKQNFSVKIANERLLSSKRGTIKRSAKTHNYSLQKTNSSIFINMAEPLSYKDYILGFVESKVDLTNKTTGEYQVEVGFKKMIKAIFLFITLLVILRFGLIIMRPNPTYMMQDLLFITVLPLMLYFLYRQINKGIMQMANRLQNDKSIFEGA